MIVVVVVICYFLAPASVETATNCSNLLEKTTATSGVIRSNFRWLYNSNLSCQWKLSSNPTIELTFLKFATEKSRDIVRVYDGGSTSSPLIANYSGYSVPAAIKSSSNQLLVTFISDTHNEHPGFVAKYQGTDALWLWGSYEA